MNRFFLKNYGKIGYIPVAKKVVYMFADMGGMIIQYQLTFTLVKKYKFYNLRLECRKKILEEHQHTKGKLFLDLQNITINNNILCNNKEIEIIPTSLRSSQYVILYSKLLSRNETSKMHIYVSSRDATLSNQVSSYTTAMKYDYRELCIYNCKKQNKIKVYKRAKYVFDSIIENDNLKFNKIKIV